MTKIRWIGMVLVSGLLLAACSTASGPIRSFTKGEELAYYNFAEPGTFEEGAYGDVLGGVTLQIVNGVYRISLTEGDGEIWWGQWGETYSDVVIDVDVEQLSEQNQNAYGVMCRVRGKVGAPVELSPELALLATAVQESGITEEQAAAAPRPTEVTAEATADSTAESTPEAAQETERKATPTAEVTPEATPEQTPQFNVIPDTEAAYGEGDGYLFLIQGAGSYSIMRSRGRALQPLVDWTTSGVIRVGPAKNHLRAVCVGDYLAFYINEQLVAEAIDDAYLEGQVGLAASATNRLGIRVTFDNLQVSAATLK